MVMITDYGKAKKNNKGHLVIISGANKNKKLHRLIYEDYHNYTIPDGYDIHHIDEDKTNNDINNLIMLKHSEHTIHHKSKNEFRIVKKGFNDKGEQVYALYNPDGIKVRTSIDYDKLERIKDRLISDSNLKETPKHSVIFETYYELGDKRTIKELSEKTGYSESSLRKWKREFDWDSQINNRDKGKLQLIQEDRLEANKTARHIYQNTIREMLRQQVIEPLQKGTLDIEIKNVSDIKRLMELDHMLSQEDKLESKEEKFSKEELDTIDLIENDEEVWEAITNKLKGEQK